MVLFYHPPELPFFHRMANRERAESTIVRNEEIVDTGSGALGGNISPGSDSEGSHMKK
jgi:hypothetical protein